MQYKVDLLPLDDIQNFNLSGTSESSLVMVESDHQVVEVSVGKQRRHKEEKRDHKDGKEERRRGKKKQRKLVEEHLEEEGEGLTYLTRRQPHTERQGKSRRLGQIHGTSSAKPMIVIILIISIILYCYLVLLDLFDLLEIRKTSLTD